MQKYVIFLNGPAGSGKDTIGDVLRELLQSQLTPSAGFSKSKATPVRARTFKFADPIRAFMQNFLMISNAQLEQGKREGTQVPIPNTSVTYRELMIRFSETFLKPVFGKGVFGVLAGEKIKSWFTETEAVGTELAVAIITDCGFEEEFHACAETIGADALYIGVQITRPEKTFSGDSRSYVKFEKSGYLIRASAIDNSYPTLEELHQRLLRQIESGNCLGDLLLTWLTINYNTKHRHENT